MARLVKQIIENEAGTKVYYDADLEEYRVQFYWKNVYLEEADYFTDDRTDAINTAQCQVKKISNWTGE